MTSPSFFRGALIALLLSLSASLIYLTTSLILDTNLAIRLTIPATVLGYILFLLSKSDIAFGKLTVVALYVLGTITLLYLWPDIIVYALFYIGFIWLVRAMYYHNHFLSALADLLFTALSFIAALSAIIQSQSIFMSFWCFFLAQALILPILNYAVNRFKATAKTKITGQQEQTVQLFFKAHRNAQEALVKLAKRA